MTFTIKEASGKVHEGICVQGAGGPAGAETLRREILRANKGKALLIYEPEPGHANGYLSTAKGNTDVRPIDLRGAEIVLATWGVHSWRPAQ
jgi:hypothetical protein